MSETKPQVEQDDPRLRHILDSAADLPADQRAAFLDEACGGDEGLRAQVESLLHALDQAEGFLANPTLERMPSTAAHETEPTQIGRYKLLQKIGEGGMGVVYMAEQERPVVRRVAIKIIKLGMDTRQVIARFEAERQALALMDHPNIARVLDAGSTDTGRPYFVMELVRGISITEYCDQNNLSTRQRLELFLPVCRAVQHAHQKGIIHRDIKPSNVLITMHDRVPVPKVIDFGIAKATSGRLTDKTLFTEYHQFVGTPEYMSPEQAEMSGLDIDTRADVYALGVLLYELLTGSTPFDANTLRQAAYAEIQRIIREVEPPKPSTRLSTLGDTLTSVAAHRAIEPRKLSALMRGDLDWIVMKCLEKDRTRRYETANELGAELERHLNNETVLARPTTTAYRVRKFVRRHRMGVAAAAAIAVTLVLGIIGTTYGLLRARNETAYARKETERATQEANKAKAVTEFVQEMLTSADPMKNSRSDITVREVIDEAAKKLASGELQDQPAVESGVRLALGVTYRSLGKTDRADFQLRKSLALAEKVYGPESAEAASALVSLGRTCVNQDRPEGIDMVRRSLNIRRKLFGDNSLEAAKSLKELAYAFLHVGHDNVAAESCGREALRICRERHADLVAASLLGVLGDVLRAKGQFTDSLAMWREAMDIFRKYEGEDSFDVSTCWFGLGATLQMQGDFQGCDEAFIRSLDIRRKSLTIKHPNIRYAALWLADLRLQHRDYLGAAELLLEFHNSLIQSDKDDPDEELVGEIRYWEGEVNEILTRLYNSWGNQQETEHSRGLWSKLMQARVAVLSAQIAAKRDDVTLFRARAKAYSMLGEFDKASADLTMARAVGTKFMQARVAVLSAQIAAKKDDATLFRERATVYSMLGEFDKASSDLTTVIRLNPSDQWDWLQRAAVTLQAGNFDDYRRQCREMLSRFGATTNRRTCEQVVKACVIVPDAVPNLGPVMELADRGVAPGDHDAPLELEWRAQAKGMAEYRAGHFDSAVEWLARGTTESSRVPGGAVTNLFLAMAQLKRGGVAEAQAAMKIGMAILEREGPKEGKFDIDFVEWIVALHAQKEAAALLGHQDSEPPSSPR